MPKWAKAKIIRNKVINVRRFQIAYSCCHCSCFELYSQWNSEKWWHFGPDWSREKWMVLSYILNVKNKHFADYLHVEYKRKRGTTDNCKTLSWEILVLPLMDFKQTMRGACFGGEGRGTNRLFGFRHERFRKLSGDSSRDKYLLNKWTINQL